MSADCVPPPSGTTTPPASELAACALLQLADSSGSARYLEDIYGRGVVYRAFQTAAEAHQFAASPQIDDMVMYHPGERAEMFGDAALGAVAAQRVNDIIVVVDVVGESQRTTTSRYGRTSTLFIELVPVEVGVEEIPTALDDLQCQLASEAVRCADRDRASTAERCVYFIDWRSSTDDVDSGVDPECIPGADFEEHMREAHRVGDVPRSLLVLESLYSTHDPHTHTVVWVRAAHKHTETAWLVQRGDSPESSGGDSGGDGSGGGDSSGGYSGGGESS